MENDKEAERKLKKRKRNNRYYLRHIERLREKAIGRYYLTRQNDETSGEETEKSFSYGSIAIFSALLALPIIAVVIFATKQKQDGEAAIAPPLQNFRKLDIGGGKVIDIPITNQP